MNSLVPYSIVTGTIGTLVQLYILNLGGTVLAVGLTITLYNAVAIPSAIFWGSVSDRLKRRRPIIVGSFASVAVLLVLFLAARSVDEVALLYVVYSFINSAPTTPINLLIMETEPKAKWASSYAKYSWLAGLGNILGLIASSAWSAFFPLKFLVLFLCVSSLAAAVVAMKLITEPAFLFEGTVLLKQTISLLQRLVTQPVVLMRTSRPQYLRNAMRILRSDFTGDLRILYASILVFYLVTGLGSVAFVPLLRAKGVPDSLVFGASTINLAVQIVSFRYFGSHIKRKNFVRDSVLSLVLRSASLAAVGLVAYLLSGTLFYVLTVLFFSLAAGVSAAVYYTTSTTMIYDTLGTDDQGYSLGIYTAFTGIATTLGALASGYVSFYASYYVTYLLMGVGFALCAWLTLRLRSTRFASG
jgi:MFS family permease